MTAMHFEDEAVCIYVDVCVFMCIYVHKYMHIYRYRLRCRCRHGIDVNVDIDTWCPPKMNAMHFEDKVVRVYIDVCVFKCIYEHRYMHMCRYRYG